MQQYQVIVGNIGTVYSGKDYTEAKATYAHYVEQSKAPFGRASGEQVTLLEDDEIKAEYNPPESDDDN